MPKYELHPAYKHWAAIERKMEANTGKSVQEWMKLVERECSLDRAERKQWLVAQGVGSVAAGCICDRLLGEMGPEDYDPERLVAEQYQGKRAGLLPIYTRFIEMAEKLGAEVKVSPCKTMVPLYRNHVFAQAKPASNARVDIGLALGDLPVSGRLVDTGGFAKKDRITHRIPVMDVSEMDDEVAAWLKKAFDRDA